MAASFTLRILPNLAMPAPITCPLWVKSRRLQRKTACPLSANSHIPSLYSSNFSPQRSLMVICVRCLMATPWAQTGAI